MKKIIFLVGMFLLVAGIAFWSDKKSTPTVEIKKLRVEIFKKSFTRKIILQQL